MSKQNLKDYRKNPFNKIEYSEYLKTIDAAYLKKHLHEAAAEKKGRYSASLLGQQSEKEKLKLTDMKESLQPYLKKRGSLLTKKYEAALKEKLKKDEIKNISYLELEKEEKEEKEALQKKGGLKKQESSWSLTEAAFRKVTEAGTAKYTRALGNEKIEKYSPLNYEINEKNARINTSSDVLKNRNLKRLQKNPSDKSFMELPFKATDYIKQKNSRINEKEKIRVSITEIFGDVPEISRTDRIHKSKGTADRNREYGL